MENIFFYWHVELYRVDLSIKELTKKLNCIFSGHHGMKLGNHTKDTNNYRN